MSTKDKNTKSVLGDDPFAKAESPYLVSTGDSKTSKAFENNPITENSGESDSTDHHTEMHEHDEIKATRSVLNELEKELDEFHRDPRHYDRKRLEEVVKTFIYELKHLLADSGYFARIQESLRPENKNWKDILFSLRRFIQSDEVDEYGLDRQFEMTIKPFFDFLYFKYFRVEVKGIDNIPYSGRSLVVANHGGVVPWDASMLKVAIFNEHPARRELRFLVDDFVFHFPFLGTLMNRIGGVRACPENAERLLHQGEVVSVFPEGVKGISKLFRDRYRLERFGRGGVIRLAMKTKSPITPVSIIGAEEIYPLLFKSHVLARPLGLPFIPITPLFPFLGPLGGIPLPTKWKVTFGTPIPFEQYSSNDLNDDILVNSETEKLRQVIQEMIKKGLEERRSVFSG